MNSRHIDTWTVARVADTMRRHDHRVRLVSVRLVRRLIRRGGKAIGLGLHVPHDDCCVIKASEALKYEGAAELDVEPGAPDEWLVVLAAPRRAWLDRATEQQVLASIWHRLTHAQIHVELYNAIDSGRLTDADVATFAAEVGPVEFEELRAVLSHDRRIPPPGDDLALYTEFVATYVELRHLDPSTLADTFPGLEDLEAVDRLIARFIDAEQILGRCRPGGAAKPAEPADGLGADIEDEFTEPPESHVGIVNSEAGSDSITLLRLRAERMQQRGNAVRAAILLTRVSRLESRARAGEAEVAARYALGSLARRLQEALGFDDAERRQWQAAMEALRAPAALGLKSAAARLLYDLQLVCDNHERPVFEINIVDWVLSFGRRSVKRRLPNQREVQIVRHLRRARARLGRVRLGPDAQNSLALLLQTEIDRAETTLRERLRPLVEVTLTRAQLQPSNLPERVALGAIVEDLLDRVQERGYLTIGDLRDAVARHDVKLPDLTLSDFVHGDPLLQADRRLAVGLDGIYRRGEVYLRGLQKVSSLAFGTALGRVLTLWVVLPFGGALATLVTLQHLVEFVQKFTLARSAVETVSTGLSAYSAGLLGVDHEGADEAVRELLLHQMEPRWTTPWSILVLGLTILGLMHWGGLRAATVRCLRALWSGARGLCWDFPRWLASFPAVRALLASPAFRVSTRWVVVPSIVAWSTWCLVGALSVASPIKLAAAATTYVLSAWGFGTRSVRLLFEEMADALGQCWDLIRVDLLPGLFHAIMAFFHALLERIDQALYAVDEWLRFRAGESRLKLGVKAAAGMIWSAIAYLVRLVVNVLVEPQINPIKHFPTVTVAHKMTAPFLVILLPNLLTAAPFSLSRFDAYAVGVFAQALLPGAFGFLVWELKENWKLYRANRSPVLEPTIVGSHGETLARLLRPGFHSGTLPRAFARLRRSDRRKPDTLAHRTRHHNRHVIEHASEAVKAFVERQLLNLLRQTQALGAFALSVEHVESTTNSIRVLIGHGATAGEPLVIAFDEQHGWLTASLAHVPNWVDDLPSTGRIVLANALVGLFHRARVDLVHEQIHAALAPAWPQYELSAIGLRARLAGGDQAAITFDLHDGTLIDEAREAQGTPPIPGTPSLIVEQLLLTRNSITWSRWVETWERDQAGESPIPLVPFNLFEAIPARQLTAAANAPSR